MQNFIPTIKETPREANSISHRLMLKAGLIRQTAAGIFAWLPLGTKVVNKIMQIIREEQERVGAQEFIIPMIQTANLWKTSGRYSEYGKEMLRMQDQYERELVFTPTNEEQMTSLLQQNVHSYKEFPQLWYTIQWKFRDEIRPRAGVMRSREFLMLDTYSFDTSAETSNVAYRRVFLSFLRTFNRLGLPIIPTKSSSGLIGGDINHEFILPCPTGETKLSCRKKLLAVTEKKDKSQSWHVQVPEDILALYEKNSNADKIFEYWQDNIAYTDEVPVADQAADQNLMMDIRGIELGHTFYFDTKYTKAFAVSISGSQKDKFTPHMGSYGIGITRLVAALIEANHDEYGIIFPRAIAPFLVSIINLQGNSAACREYSERVYHLLQELNIDVLLDNGSDSAGVKLTKHDLIGIPVQLIIGQKEQASETVLLKDRSTQQKQVFKLTSCLNHLKVLK